MDENSQDRLREQATRTAAAWPGRGGWLVVFLLAGILAVLGGIYSLRPDGQPDATPRAEIPEPVESPPVSEPAVHRSDLASPLPTTAEPLLEEVGRAMDQLVETFPDNLDCLEMKARFLKWTGKADEAVKVWEECLDLDPRYAHAYLGMAEAAAKKGDHQRAANLASKSMQTAPRSFQARAVLAEALVHLDRPEEAIAVLEEFLQTDPRSQGYFLLGRAYTLMEQLEKAKEYYEAAIRKYPEYAEAYYGLSRVCVQLKQTDAARESMTKYRELMAKRNPGRQGMDMTPESFVGLCVNAAVLYTDTARIYHAHERPVEAERLWRRAAALSSENVECRQALAWWSRSEGKTLEAIGWLEELAGLDPKSPDCWLEIGNLRLKMIQLQSAEEALQEAVTVAPNDARGYAALAALYLQSGQKAPEALTLARKAVELAPTAANQSLLAKAEERTKQ